MRCVATTQASTASAATTIAAVTCSASSSADQISVSTGCASWTWPIFATPPSASPWYQAKNADEHRDDRDVGEAEPLGRAGVEAAAHRDRATGHDQERRGQHERPADHLPAAVAAAAATPPSAYPSPPSATAPSTSRSAPAMPSTPCVAANASTAIRPATAASQNACGGPLAGAGDRPRRRRRGQQPDDDARVRGGEVLERERAEEREPDDDADADEREPRQVAAVGQRLAPDREQGAGQHGGDERAAEADERRVEVLDREPRRGQREREQDARRPSPRRGRVALPTCER